MSSTSQKHGKLLAEPIGYKPVSELPGITENIRRKLEYNGFGKVRDVLGKYLVLQKDKEKFQKWLKDTCDASTEQSEDCYNCIYEWCEQFV